ncbi:MAG: hypothetical protein HZA90_07110 [Verrucomicrobia bacterium]|nr:hypothetical protein [Verrucomicrobiota bacterium]
MAIGCWLLLAPASPAFVYENPYEFSAEGDFNGDGLTDLVLVDKTTGAYRIGLQQAGGAYTWLSARSSGIDSVTGFTVGRLNSLLYESLAFASPDANRVNILDATNAAVAGLPTPVYIGSVGPNAVQAINILTGFPGYDDLFIGSAYNSAPNASHHTTLTNDGTTNRVILSDLGAVAPVGGANRIGLSPAPAHRMGFFHRGSTETFRVYDFTTSGSGAQTLSLGGFIPTNQWLHGKFSATNNLPQVLFYRPGQSFFSRYQVVEATPGNFTLPSGNQLNLGQPIYQIFSIPTATTNKLLVLFGNGETAKAYYFDGLSTLTVIQTFTADAGEHFTGAGVVGGNDFTLFSGSTNSGVSTKFKNWNWNGTGYTAGQSGDLPYVSQFSGRGNVLQFQREPFVTNAPVLLRLNNAGDWTGQPLIGGAPPALTVRSETFLSATQGLANPSTVSVGPIHPLAQFGLANQYSNAISLFSFQAPIGDKVSDVSISPTPGVYSAAITVKFTATDPSHLIYYRIGNAASWSQFTGQTIYVFSNTVVQYYGTPAAGNAKSAIKSAAYSFTSTTAAIDSDADGVPDYVESTYGLNPSGGRDSDGDGFSDFEELLHGTDAKSNASFPTTNSWPANKLHIDDQAVFDLSVRPQPWDGFSNRATLIATGATLYAWDLHGSLLGLAKTTNPPLPFARMTNIVVDPLKRLISLSTDLHYDILTTNADKTVGREMIGLVGVPALPALAVPYVFAGTNVGREATNWVLSASNAWTSLTRALLTNQITVNRSLESLLFEQAVAILLGSRSNSWWSNLTLFPFRVADVGRTNPPESALLSLETNLDLAHPGYQLKATFATISNLVENSTVAGITNLRRVAQDIYRINSLLNNTNPGSFISPIDALRTFLWNGTLDSNYLHWATTSNAFASASSGVTTILASLQPRSTTNLALVVRSDSFGSACRILDVPGTNAPYTLLNSSALPFSFPDNFQLPTGSLIYVYGYTDVTNTACTNRAIEVISIALAAVPIATDQDSDASLLIDSWERKFFGDLGQNAFVDSDGDGYRNLQEMWEGSDPRDVLGIPSVPAASLSRPVLEIVPDGALIRLRFNWPSAYLSKIQFRVRSSSTVNAAYTDLGTATPAVIGTDRWEITVATPLDPQQFYLIHLLLAPL